MLHELLAEFVDDFFPVSNVGLFSLWNVFVPEVTATDVFETELFSCPLN
jgi:hypothetical protein